jgi:hypothetical protein
MVKQLRGGKITQTLIDTAKKDFNTVFQSTGDKSGNEFKLDFIKENSKSQEGISELIAIYKRFVKDNEDLFGTTENINEILNYGERSRRAKFIKSLGNLSRDPENQVKRQVFLIDGLNYKKDQALKALGVISSPTPSQIEMVKELVGEEPPVRTGAGASTASVMEEEEKEGEKKPEKSGSKKMSSEQFKQFEKERQQARDKGGAGMGAGARSSDDEKMTMEPPTFSPDEMLSTKEDIAEEMKAQADAREARPTTGMTAQEEAELLDIPEPQKNVEMKIQKQDRKSEIDDLQPLPSKSDFIPPMRLGTRGKDVRELLDDLSFFLKNFKSQLKREGEFFKQIDKTNLSQVRQLHDRIVGKLAPKQKSKDEGKRVGIIVNADDYIREQMKRILQEQTFSSLRPQDVVIDVGSKQSENNTKDFGDFEVKRTIDGGLASKREAVYRYMPSQKDDEVGERGLSTLEKRKPKRLALPKSRLNNERTNAIRMNLNNPFRVPQKTMKLKYLF